MRMRWLWSFLGDKNVIKITTECYVALAFHLYLKISMAASVWYIFDQNSFGSSWDIAFFIFSLF